MKNLLLTAVGFFFLLTIVAGKAMAQVTVTGHISAEVIDAINTMESDTMNFGSFSTGDQGGSIIIIPGSGAVVSTLTVVPSDDPGNPAVFSVAGSKDATFAITLPVGATILTHSSGFNALTVTDWTADSEQGSDAGALAGGSLKVSIGATLQVGTIDKNPKGIYTGSYQITFAYN